MPGGGAVALQQTPRSHLGDGVSQRADHAGNQVSLHADGHALDAKGVLLKLLVLLVVVVVVMIIIIEVIFVVVLLVQQPFFVLLAAGCHLHGLDDGRVTGARSSVLVVRCASRSTSGGFASRGCTRGSRGSDVGCE